MEDGGDPEVGAWDAAQTARTHAVIGSLPGRDALRDRIHALLDAPAVLGVRVAGDRVFTTERGAGRDQAVLLVRGDAGRGEPRLLLDPAALLGDATAALDWWHPSPDGALVAVGLSTGGDELSTLRVVRTEDGSLLDTEITRTRAASVAWHPDGGGFAYTRYPDPATVPPEESGYHRRVHEHRLGADPAADAILWGDLPDPTAWPDVRISDDGRWTLVHVAIGWDRTDVHLGDRASGRWTTIIAGVDALTDLRVRGDHLIGTTTLDAPRGRVVRAPLRDPDPQGWEDLVPEGDAVVEGVSLGAQALFVATSRRARSELLRVEIDDDGRPVGPPVEVALPEAGTLASLDAHDVRDEAWAVFTSFARPPQMLRVEGATASEPGPVDGPVDPDRFAVDVLEVTSTDGAAITVFALHLADTAPDPTTPAIVTGYGGFGVTMSPAFSAEGVAHVEGGGLWAVACIRGGAEEGEAWHRAGQREHKPQALADFEAAVDELVGRRWTSRERVAIRGGSNGGLLVTAVLTRRPDLCAAALAAVPLCDMVRYPRFRIARLWVPEYGDPDEPADLAVLLSYSPYHRVAAGTDYPAVLITTGAQDSRVDPLHARKMAAALQAATTGERGPVLLRVEQDAGHGQGKPTSRRAEEAADALAFLTHRWATPPG